MNIAGVSSGRDDIGLNRGEPFGMGIRCASLSRVLHCQVHQVTVPFMIRSLTSLLSAYRWSLVGLLCVQGAAAAAEPLDITPAAIEHRLLQDVTYLASDELEGRGVRTRGIDLAADFIAAQFAAAGLKTDGYQGTPFHEFTVYSPGSSGGVQGLAWEFGEHKLDLAASEDFTSLMVTASGNFHLPLAFVGYGITDKERKYDDYVGVDVRGHAVIMLRQEPQSRQADSIFQGTEPTDHAFLLTKIKTAIRHGAAAIILVTDTASLEANGIAGQPAQDRLLESELTSALGSESIPVVHCRRSIVELWLRSAGISLPDWEVAVDKTLQPASRLMAGQQISGRIALTRPGRKLRNVIASLPGAGDLAHETIVIGAHYDHLGRGGWGSLATGANVEIHNGADDNASGTAVLLEAARQLATDPNPRRRNVIFAAFTGEELGLYGSKRYVQDPLAPLADTIAMLNLDMVGRLRQDRLTVYGVGTADEWPVWLSKAATGPKLGIVGEASGFGPSDHAPFYERGVPVLHFFTGFHAEYHRPPDDVELLNIPGMRRITTLLCEMVRQLDAAPKRPRSASSDQPLQLSDEQGLVALGSVTMPAPARQLGVVLQMAPQGEGLRIESVQSASAAERLGLLPGDVLLRMNGQALKTRTDFTHTFHAAPAGTAITLVFDRGGIVREITIRL